MMPAWRVVFFIVIFLAISVSRPAPAADVTQEQIDQCVNKGGSYSLDIQVDGCTAAIESGRWSGKGLAWAFYNRGSAYFVKGDNDRAIADRSEAIRLDPKMAIAYSNRCAAYLNKGDNDRAIVDCEKAIQLDPNLVLALVNRAGVWLNKANYDRAIADSSEAIRLDPKSAVAYGDRAQAYLNKGDNDRAIADSDEAIRLDLKNASAYTSRGFAYLKKGEIDRTIADSNEAIRLDPKSSFAFFLRGVGYLNKGDYNRAIADSDEAVRLDSKSALGYYGRGLANLYAGSLPKALADLTQATSLDPKSPQMAWWLDIASKRSGLSGQLAEASNRIDMTQWPAPIIRLFLGQLTPEAVLAAADDPDPATKKGRVCYANFYSGIRALQQGVKAEALRLFQVAAADCPRGLWEFSAAAAELKSLGARP